MIRIVCRVAIIVFYALSLGIYLAKDGQPKEGKYSFATGLLSVAIMGALMVGAGTFD